jgi:hypothetical protein
MPGGNMRESVKFAAHASLLPFDGLHLHPHSRLVTSRDVTGKFYDRIVAKLPDQSSRISRRN